MQGEAEGKKTEEVIKCYSTGVVTRQHEAILHVLDRELPGDDGQIPKYYPTEGFESSVQAWEGIPVVFERGGEHVDLDAFAKNPEAECKRVNATIVGEVSKAWIDKHGRSKLMAMLNIRDAEVEKLFNEGKLSLSTGMYASAINDGVRQTVVGGVRPNHILLFEESDVTGALPRDLGAGLLNNVRPCALKNEVKMPEQVPVAPEAATGIAPGVLDRLKTLLVEATQILSGKAPVEPEVPATASVTPPVTTLTNAIQENDPMDAELKAQVDHLTKKLDEMNLSNTTLAKERDALLERVEKIDLAAKEEKWNNVKQNLEVGRIDTPEKLAAERAAFEAAPVDFMLAMTNTKLANTRQKEGVDAITAPDAEIEAYAKTKKEVNSRIRRSQRK